MSEGRKRLRARLLGSVSAIAITAHALAQSMLDDINAMAFRDGEAGVALDRVTLTDRTDGAKIVTVEGRAGKRPATMNDFAEACRRGYLNGGR